MAPWLDDIYNTIRLTAEDGKRYAYHPRLTNPLRGFIQVRCGDNKLRSVTGSRVGDKFFTDARGKNARAILSQKEIDDTLGTTLSQRSLLDVVPATELAPEHLRTKNESKELADMTEEEIEEYLASKYGPPPSD